MATNKQTFQFTRNFHKDVVEFDGYISLNASAAVVAGTTSSVASMGGIKEPDAGTSWFDEGATVAKTSTGEYTITLAGKYLRLLSATPVLCSNGSPPAFDVVLGPDTVNPDTALGAQTIKVYTRNASAVAANVTAPCGIRISLRLKNR